MQMEFRKATQTFSEPVSKIKTSVAKTQNAL